MVFAFADTTLLLEALLYEMRGKPEEQTSVVRAVLWNCVTIPFSR